MTTNRELMERITTPEAYAWNNRHDNCLHSVHAIDLYNCDMIQAYIEYVERNRRPIPRNNDGGPCTGTLNECRVCEGFDCPPRR